MEIVETTETLLRPSWLFPIDPIDLREITEVGVFYMTLDHFETMNAIQNLETIDPIEIKEDAQTV